MKYQYRCGMPGCGKQVGSSVAMYDYPTCNGNDNSHHRLMDFIESESKAIPPHVEEKHKARKKEARWLP